MNITPVIEAVISLIAVVLTTFIIPYIKSKTTNVQRKELSAWVDVAVHAAEQLYIGSGRGPEKKDYVLEWLRDRNIEVDADRIDAMIEAAVYKMNNVICLGDSVDSTER